ncbi:MAG: DUF1549 domain-containing protein [Planctomycetaceae bacterium]|nr:DUF1549 domain-containing protein [Planctomycetaceae bacterium]MDG2390264.1 DUF1549 domain-containing protein [Planctomycetaceae bacterium]
MSRQTLIKTIRLHGLTAVLVLSSFVTISAQEPMHVRIDQLIDQSTKAPQAEVINDHEFVRRVSIDLIGMPPTIEELNAFLADGSPDKRVKLVDQLLNSNEYVRHFTTSLDIMLMERRRNQHVKQEEWLPWLHKSVQQNKPWNELAREVLGSDGVDLAKRAPVRFYLDRGSEPNLLTRDVARIFFGRDYQCAQCHDHPIIDDYKQSDYHGLYSFLAGGYEFKAPDKKTYYAEKAGSEAIFESVFIPDSEDETAPKLPGGPPIAEPKFYPGDEYTVKPDKTVRPVLKYSRRQKLAELVNAGDNRAFNENIANRLWAHMMGRGLVEPIDLHHTANPPSHPALMKLLGEEMARLKFDMKAFVREIALSKTYQRSIDLPTELVAKSQQSAEKMPTIEAELAALKTQTDQAAASYEEMMNAWYEAKQAFEPVKTELRAARKKTAELYKPYEAAEKALTAAKANLQPQLDLIAKYETITMPADNALALLKTDDELVKALAPIKAKIAAIEKKAEPLRKAVTDKEAALVKPSNDLHASWKVIDEIRTRIVPLEQIALAKQAEAAKARHDSLDRWNELNRLTAQLETTKHFVSYGPAETTAIAASVKHQQAIAQQREATLALEQYTVEFQAKQKTWQAVSNQYQQTTKKLASAEADMDKLPTAVATLKAARQNMVDAVASMPADEELTQLVSFYEVKAESYQLQLTAAEKTSTEMQVSLKELQPKYEAMKQEFATVEAEMKKRADLRTQLTQAAKIADTEANSTRDAANTMQANLTGDWASQFAVAPLKPLMPEQFAWSVLEVTGVRQRYIEIARAEIEKKTPLSGDDKKDPSKVAAREQEVEALMYEKLKGSVGAFVAVYGAGDGQNQYDYFATVDQALFAANGASIIGWVAPASGNVTHRMLQNVDLAAGTQDLYLTCLTRQPTAAETKAVVDYINSRPEEKQACIVEIAWALLNSAEFRFNH